MKVEVRATGLRAMREKRGLTQRKLAHDLGISQNYIPAIEANSRQAGPKLQRSARQVFRLPVRGFVRGRPDRQRHRTRAGAQS